jgi:Concanavalin A-like lectin/glucanases superfamily
MALTIASLAVVTASNSAGSATARSNATKVGRPASARVVALWHMDERSGKVMRDSIRHSNGHLIHVRLGLPGFSGTAYGFTGSSSYVSVPSASGLNPRRRRIAIKMHLKTRSAPAKPDWDLIRKGYHYTPGGEYLMEYQPSGRASCAFKGSIKRSQLFTHPRLNDGRWHTIKCVKTGHRIQVVVDGRKFSKRVRVGRIANGAPVVIGARPRSEFFRGSLDEAKIKIG